MSVNTLIPSSCHAPAHDGWRRPVLAYQAVLRGAHQQPARQGIVHMSHTAQTNNRDAGAQRLPISNLWTEVLRARVVHAQACARLRGRLWEASGDECKYCVCFASECSEACSVGRLRYVVRPSIRLLEWSPLPTPHLGSSWCTPASGMHSAFHRPDQQWHGCHACRATDHTSPPSLLPPPTPRPPPPFSPHHAD